MLVIGLCLQASVYHPQHWQRPYSEGAFAIETAGKNGCINFEGVICQPAGLDQVE